MATRPNSFVRLAFGPFELDAAAGELRKRGIRVRLSKQPFHILVVLVAHPGELVTREQLRQSVWTDGTFVDFEGGLNAAMAKLRRSLGDSADNPRYIETVPGRGYRFIGTLREPSEIEAPAPDRQQTLDQQQTNIVALAPERPVPRDAAKGARPVRRWWLAGVACVGAIAVASAVYFYFHRPPVLGEKGNIVLADFVNSTGDPVFDETLRQGLAVQLQESTLVGIVSDERIQHTLALMGQPASARLSPALAREVCERTASAAFVEGSIAPLGSQYVLGVTAKRCGGDIVDEEQVQARKKEDVLNALTQIARKFRKRAGEPIAAIRKHDRPLAEATTPSLEALRAYSAARNAAFQTGVTAAVPLLQRAIDLDPQFAMAHAFLGRVYADIGESVLSAESTKRAYELRERASDPERFFITFSYYRQVTGDLARAQQTLELWVQTYPRDSAPHSLLSGYRRWVPGNLKGRLQRPRKQSHSIRIPRRRISISPTQILLSGI